MGECESGVWGLEIRGGGRRGNGFDRVWRGCWEWGNLGFGSVVGVGKVKDGGN